MRDGLSLPDPAPVNHHPELLHDVFFANQVINAAAATQALTTIVLNIQSPTLKVGADLAHFKDFVKHLDPPLSGLAIHNAAFIRDAHLSVARRPPSPAADGQGPPPPRPGEVDEDVYHYITWVPMRTPSATLAVFELDSLHDSPLYIGEVPCNPADEAPAIEWVTVVAPRLRSYVAVYAAAEIKYRSLAVVDHRILREVAALERLRSRVEDEGETRPGDEAEEARLLNALAEEDERLAGWMAESARRRHDYMPFLVETLKLLASKGELTALIDAAREQKRATAKAAAKAAKAARGGKSKTSKGDGGRDGAAGGSSHG